MFFFFRDLSGSSVWKISQAYIKVFFRARFKQNIQRHKHKTFLNRQISFNKRLDVLSFWERYMYI